MEKYCQSCGAVFNDLKFKLCPYCGGELDTRYGRQPIPRKLRHEVFQRDGYRCRECGASKDETSLEIDHIVPVARGGTNDIDNLQTLCRECNRMKHTDEWVGGETDLEVAQNELSVLKEQLNRSEEKLMSLTDEDEIIKCRFNNIKLKESIQEVEQKINLLKEEEQIFKEKQEEIEKIEKLYMKLYVELDEESIQLLSKHYDLEYYNKNDLIHYLAENFSEKEIQQSIINEKIHSVGSSDYKYFSELINKSPIGANILLNNIGDFENKNLPSNEFKIKFLISKYSKNELENLINIIEQKLIDKKVKRANELRGRVNLNRTHVTINRPTKKYTKNSSNNVIKPNQIINETSKSTISSIEELTLEEISPNNNLKLKLCKHCGEKINFTAKICPHCLKWCD